MEQAPEGVEQMKLFGIFVKIDRKNHKNQKNLKQKKKFGLSKISLGETKFYHSHRF
jgi:hypothetical protein